MTGQRLRFFEKSLGQRHIVETDKYLYKSPKAGHNLVVIGTGTMGQEHMYVATLLGRARIHGIYDSNAHSMDMAEDNFKRYCNDALVRYGSLQEACMDPDIDAVMICTPNHTHFDILSVAMGTDKPIFLEKPMATSIEDAKSIIDACEGYEAFVQLGLQYRYKSQYVEALHELKQRKSLGSLKTISLSEHRPPFLDKVDQWNKFNQNTGGTLVEKCCHYFDLMNLMADAAPIRVYASGGQAVNFADFTRDGAASDIDDHAFVIIEYANGVRGNFTLNMFCHDFTEDLTLCGDVGRLTANEVFNVHQRQPSKATISLQLGEGGASKESDVTYSRDIEESGHHGATYFEHIAFIDQIEGKATQSATLLQGRWSMIVACAAQASIAEGQVIQINEFMKVNDLSKFLD